MPRVSSTTICFRLDSEKRRLLEAVAYDEVAGSSGWSDVPASEVNLSDFVRDVLDEFVEQYVAKTAGGARTLVERYHDAQVRELESQLEAVRDGRSTRQDEDRGERRVRRSAG